MLVILQSPQVARLTAKVLKIGSHRDLFHILEVLIATEGGVKELEMQPVIFSHKKSCFLKQVAN